MSQCEKTEKTLISNAYQEYIGNGFYLARLKHNNESYRLGATTPQFRKELTSLALAPSLEELHALQEKGIYLNLDAQAPRVGLTCGGVGSVWPGLGRGLYDTFPAARAAMDRIAAIADWDILALMDETDLEKLSRSRWQMPYLFFIEYAQASYLNSLGFSAHIATGHSLGELISLSLADVFSLETAWQIFDRRAVYIDGIEQDATSNMGMMVVYAPLDIIQKTIDTFPDLYICNQNTLTQYILGGKKDVLAEAKRTLRKVKCPSIVLPINMAFHHPHLHVLRQSAFDGLMELPINPPQIPVISNVTADVYPSDKVGICEHIVDLDENTVRWVDCVRTMWDKYDIRHFVELGSADNVSNLIKDIEPQALCIAVTQKNNEVASMRKAVAHLYALGHIPLKTLHAMPKDYDSHAQWQLGEEQDANTSSEAEKDYIPLHVQDILPILTMATGFEVQSLRAHMDLRHDLAISSNSFPAMLYAFEENFGITVQFEDVMHVATVLDLANVVAKLRNKNTEGASDFQAAPEKTAQRHILELCYGKSLSQNIFQNETVPLPVLVLGECQADISGIASVHVVQKAQDAHALMQDSTHEYASLLLSLPKRAQLRPWNYPYLCAQISACREEFLQKSKAEHKKIYFQATEHFSPFIVSDEGMETSWLSGVRMLQSLQAATQTIFPHANIYGVDEIELMPQEHKAEQVHCVAGMTREAIIHIQAHADVSVRCQSLLALRGVTANGRRTNTYYPAVKAQILAHYPQESLSVSSIFEQTEALSKQEIQCMAWNKISKNYSVWHEKHYGCDERRKSSFAHIACLELLAKMVFDTVSQDKKFVLQSIAQMRCSQRLQDLFIEPQTKSLIFSWSKTNAESFDGQLVDASGAVLLTIKNARFTQMDL